MKIIKKGRQQKKGWTIEKICTGSGNGGGGCGAQLLVEQEDLFKTHQYIRDEHNVFITFKCLQCGVLTDLSDSEKPPSYIQEILRDESN